MPRNSKQKKTGIQARVRNATEGAREYLEERRDKADKYVGHHPLQSLAIAVGVGAVIGAGITVSLMRPRHRSFFDRLFGLF